MRSEYLIWIFKEISDNTKNDMNFINSNTVGMVFYSVYVQILK
jgi:hypothetical protein